MSEVWVTSTLVPSTQLSFNWKIENFSKWLKVFGNVGIESPEFKISDAYGMIHSLQVKISKYYNVKARQFRETESGVEVDMTNFTLLAVTVEKVHNESKFSLAGTLDFVLDDVPSSGAFGKPDQDKFVHSSNWSIDNPTSKISYVTQSDYGDYTQTYHGFLVSNDAQTSHLKLMLSTPGRISNVIRTVPHKETFKEIGGERLMADMKSLLSKKEEYADFSILCDKETFSCHEAILRARSPVIDRMFQQNMRESTTRELVIEDVGKDVVDAFLEYLYSGEVTKSVKNESELIYIADKYQVPGLLELCFLKLPEVQENMVVDILTLSDRHMLTDFKKVAMQRVFANKVKFFEDENFVEKLKLSPHLLVELIQM